MTPVVVDHERRSDLWARFPAVFDGVWPEYNLHGDVMARYWHRLHPEFGRFQLALVTPADDGGEEEILAAARGIPVRWDGTPAGLGPGIDDAISSGFADHDAGLAPDTLCALGIEVAPRHRRGGHAATMLTALCTVAAAAGLGHVIVPVRPTWKERYPLVPIERYVRWTTADGEPFDPWIRLHVRAGGTLSVPIPRSSLITGTVAEWEGWTGMAFPETDDYVIPAGLSTVRIDRDADRGTFWEPNVWVVHRARGGR